MGDQRRCILRVDGEEYESLYPDVIAVEVADRSNEPSSFAIQLALYRQPNGTWTRLDEPDATTGGFAPWQRITILGGYGDSPDVLIDGYVAGVAPHITTDNTASHLLVWGYDASYAMDIEEKVVAWPDKKYSEVASAIFSAYGLTPDVTDTQVIYKEEDDLLLQRGTDWQYLGRLAARMGFEALVQGATGYFGPPPLSVTPQIDVNLEFGAESNALWFEPRVSAHLPSRFSMARINPVEKKVETVDVSATPLQALGGRDGDALRSGRPTDKKASGIVPVLPLSDQQSMEALATGARRLSDWIVTGEGELDGSLYGAPLRARGTVFIRGAGKTFSGVYYVNEVIHRFTSTGYTQRFKVTRNGVDLKGNEQSQDEGAALVDVARKGRVVAP